MTQALAERISQPMVASEWTTMKEQAGMLIKTGFLPPSIKTAEQVITIALTGRELGIGMMEAIRGINVIQGKPSVSPQLMLALAIRTGQMESYSLKVINGAAEAIVKRKGWPEHKVVFGPTEAKALGLAGKDNYLKQPETMFKWRALAQALRFTFPDAISGIYTFDEMGAEVEVKEDGSITMAEAPLPPSVAMPKEKAIDAETTATDGITDAQRRKLFKFAERAYGEKYEEALKGYLHVTFGINSTKELQDHQYLQAIDWLEELAKTTNPNADRS